MSRVKYDPEIEAIANAARDAAKGQKQGGAQTQTHAPSLAEQIYPHLRKDK
jgi:hypothetical protein